MLNEGQILDDKYRIVGVLGKGGMGVVYAGEHGRIRRQVAIKVLHKEVDAFAVQRFEKEAQAAGQIGSDHIVEVLDVGVLPTGEHYMVMEYLDGETLKQRIRRQLLAPEQTIPIFADLLEGLAAAHAARIIHRDLKPDNVFLLRQKAGRRDFVKILDFGISKFAAVSEEQATRTGTVMGTPVYMSPEQVKSSHEVDERSDLYSAGVILFQSITGRVPFKATTFTELLFKIVYEAPPHPTVFVPDLDPAFCALVMKAMARDPAARFQTAADLRAALSAWGAKRGAEPVALPIAVPSSPSTPGRPAPPDPGDDAPTELYSSDSRGAVSVRSATPVVSLETQQSWAPANTVRAGARRGKRVAWLALVSLAAAAGAAWFLLGRAPPGEPAAPAEAAARAQAAPSAPVSAAPPEPATAPTPEPPASSSPVPAAATSARPARTAHPGKPASDARPARPSGTVSDFGY